jgi:hypothetical protein
LGKWTKRKFSCGMISLGNNLACIFELTKEKESTEAVTGT